jgi:hypothetical protein
MTTRRMHAAVSCNYTRIYPEPTNEWRLGKVSVPKPVCKRAKIGARGLQILRVEGDQSELTSSFLGNWP